MYSPRSRPCIVSHVLTSVQPPIILWGNFIIITITLMKLEELGTSSRSYKADLEHLINSSGSEVCRVTCWNLKMPASFSTQPFLFALLGVYQVGIENNILVSDGYYMFLCLAYIFSSKYDLKEHNWLILLRFTGFLCQFIQLILKFPIKNFLCTNTLSMNIEKSW